MADTTIDLIKHCAHEIFARLPNRWTNNNACGASAATWLHLQEYSGTQSQHGHLLCRKLSLNALLCHTAQRCVGRAEVRQSVHRACTTVRPASSRYWNHFKSLLAHLRACTASTRHVQWHLALLLAINVGIFTSLCYPCFSVLDRVSCSTRVRIVRLCFVALSWRLYHSRLHQYLLKIIFYICVASSLIPLIRTDLLHAALAANRGVSHRAFKK